MNPSFLLRIAVHFSLFTQIMLHARMSSHGQGHGVSNGGTHFGSIPVHGRRTEVPISQGCRLHSWTLMRRPPEVSSVPSLLLSLTSPTGQYVAHEVAEQQASHSGASLIGMCYLITFNDHMLIYTAWACPPVFHSWLARRGIIVARNLYTRTWRRFWWMRG